MTLETTDTVLNIGDGGPDLNKHMETLIEDTKNKSDYATKSKQPENEPTNEFKSEDVSEDNNVKLSEGGKFEFIDIDGIEQVNEKVRILSNHYHIPDILIKSLFDLNNKKKKLYPANDINNNSSIITTPFGDDDNVCKFLLSLEAEIIAFIIKPNIDSLKMRPLNSYYRLLAHQLAEYYHLGHILSNDGSSMVLFKINTSLINADDETKKSATFDNSGNIKPLDFRNLKFDPNEKLNRMKLFDLYNHYKAQFEKANLNNNNNINYNNNNNDKNLANGGDIVGNFQNLDIRDNNTSNIRIMKRKDEVTPIEQKNEQPIKSIVDEEETLTKEERYQLAKEKIDKENEGNEDEDEGNDEGDDETEIIINQDENGTLRSRDQYKYNLNDNNTFNYNPDASNDYNNNYNYNQYNYNNKNKYNRRGSDFNNNGYRKGRNYRRNSNLNNKNMNYNNNGNPGYNNYGYNNYGYYPNNQMYQYNNPQSTSYGYMVAPPVHIPSNNIPMTSPVLGSSSAGYYYVPVIPPTENIDNRLNDYSNGDIADDSSNAESETTNNRASSRSPGYSTPLNSRESPIVPPTQHSMPIPINSIPIPLASTPIIPNTSTPVYQYYYPPPNVSNSNPNSRNNNSFYNRASPPGSNPMMYYNDNINNGYGMGSGRNNKYNNGNRSGKGYVRKNDKLTNQTQSQTDDVNDNVPKDDHE